MKPCGTDLDDGTWVLCGQHLISEKVTVIHNQKDSRGDPI